MELKELMVREKKELTENQSKFILIHNNILNAGAMITNSVISLSKNLKVMRDEKLYLEIDCESFEDYAERICGLKRSQAYKYIQILEQLGEEFVQSTGQIGIEKLTLLAKLPEEEKQIIIEQVNVEDVSVNELKKEIEQLKDINNSQQSQIEDFESDKQKLIDEHLDKVKELDKQIVSLKNQVKKLKTDSTKIVQSTGQNEELEKLKLKIEELEKDISSKENLIKSNAHSIEIYQQRVESMQKQLDINNSNELVEFKLKFNELQNILCDLSNLLSKVPEDKKENCKKALKKVVEIYA